MIGKFLILFKRLFKANDVKGKISPEIFLSIKKLQDKIDIKFTSYNYYVKALTHRSYLEINHELSKSNERLEFLGDSVLNMIVAKYLFFTFNNSDEGFLTKSRSACVNRDRLAAAARNLGLQDYVLYNQKYLRGSEDGFSTILADTLEALIGAIYLDHGIPKVEKFVIDFVIQPFEEDEAFLSDHNYKGKLLEYTHAKKLATPKYILVSSDGPSHKKEFVVNVVVGDEIIGIGHGKNKKSAEQNASKDALQKLGIVDF